MLKAEILWTLKLITSHYSFNSSKDTSHLFSAMFPDSHIAQQFPCGEQIPNFSFVRPLEQFKNLAFLAVIGGTTLSFIFLLFSFCFSFHLYRNDEKRANAKRTPIRPLDAVFWIHLCKFSLCSPPHPTGILERQPLIICFSSFLIPLMAAAGRTCLITRRNVFPSVQELGYVFQYNIFGWGWQNMALSRI